MELLSGIQKSALDCNPCLASLGLSCIGMLCENDVLDFYKAWKVVQRWHPKLPTSDLVVQEWIALIGHGHLDAHMHPDKLEAILQILWSATKHANPKVGLSLFNCLKVFKSIRLNLEDFLACDRFGEKRTTVLQPIILLNWRPWSSRVL